jgi:carbon-monoxide dehydrogenase iron sulfur subunit
MAKILMIHPDKCIGCHNCALACSFVHEKAFRPRAARVHVYNWEHEGFSVPMMCQQCDNAACMNICPTGALYRNLKTHAVGWHPSRCTRCRMCVQACPFGNIVYDAFSGNMLKCDYCGGHPNCVQFCPTGALEYVEDTISTRSRKKAFAAKIKDAYEELEPWTDGSERFSA